MLSELVAQQLGPKLGFSCESTEVAENSAGVSDLAMGAMNLRSNDRVGRKTAGVGDLWSPTRP